jgi:hypothetical protein
MDFVKVWDKRGIILHRDTVDENENQRDNVHGRKQPDHAVLDVDVHLAALGDADQHPTDTELDGDDGGDIADFKDQEELGG